MKTYLVAIATAIVTQTSCVNNTQDDLEPIVPEVAQEEEKVTYNDVVFVFDNICTACHSNPPQNGAPMSLASYLAVKDAVLNRGLLDRISREEGTDGAMPLGGPRLPQETIDLMVRWSEDGLLEN
ncbi:MAG: hypothetical protein ABJM06_02785 [Gilvibacter sp.]